MRSFLVLVFLAGLLTLGIAQVAVYQSYWIDFCSTTLDTTKSPNPIELRSCEPGRFSDDGTSQDGSTRWSCTDTKVVFRTYAADNCQGTVLTSGTTNKNECLQAGSGWVMFGCSPPVVHVPPSDTPVIEPVATTEPTMAPVFIPAPIIEPVTTEPASVIEPVSTEPTSSPVFPTPVIEPVTTTEPTMVPVFIPAPILGPVTAEPSMAPLFIPAPISLEPTEPTSIEPTEPTAMEPIIMEPMEPAEPSEPSSASAVTIAFSAIFFVSVAIASAL